MSFIAIVITVILQQTIQYDGNYLKLSDSGNGTYAIIMGGNRLPPSDQKSGDNSLPNCKP